MSNFDACLPVVLAHEGGFTDDKDDPGSITNLGLSIVEDAEALTKLFGHPPAESDMRTLTQAQVAPIYKQNYWDRLSLDSVAGANISLCLFDMGVLIGVGGVARMIQGILGLTQDGVIGPNTLKAINSVNERELCIKFMHSCIDYFIHRVEKDSELHKFLAGWENRAKDLSVRCGVSL